MDVLGPRSGLVARFASRFRFPWLVALLGALFALDLVLPDPIPFADELFLGILAALAASWRRRRPGTSGGEPRATLLVERPEPRQGD